MVDNDCTFKSQRTLAVKKTNQRCSWVLRTFLSRDPQIMKTLWRSLCQPIQDYGSQLWAPVGNHGELQNQEGPLRNFLRRWEGFENLNYWQRLFKAKIMSCERRNQRYRILYVWKSLNDMVPSLGLKTKFDPRNGTKIILPKYSGKIMRIRTLQEKHIKFEGSRLFNSLPRILREFSGSLKSFKYLLDEFLWKIPDCPILIGYSSHNLDKDSHQSNCITDWSHNLNLSEWIPDSTHCLSDDD